MRTKKSTNEYDNQIDRDLERFMNRKIKLGIFLGVFVGILGVIASVLIGLMITKNLGKSSLNANVSSEAPLIHAPNEAPDIWEDGIIRYEGDLYRYNEEILTFLVLGIDHEGVVEEAADGISGGQSDAIFLVVCNQSEKKIEVIAVNRNTMTEIERYNEEGEFVGLEIAQIAIQHGYGDGLALSCERSRESVSKLFYKLPIHGYLSIHMDGIIDINDAIGGVEVTMQEDTTFRWFSYKKGDVVLLEGQRAYWYLRDRDVMKFDSASDRLERQKQYINAFLQKMIRVVKNDITVVKDIFQIAQQYIVTDVSIEEMTYLASTLVSYQFSMDHMYSMQGETIRGEQLEEFYKDDTALYELIIDVFYQKIED